MRKLICFDFEAKWFAAKYFAEHDEHSTESERIKDINKY